SSRRRHTRSKRDWSSDVCSSDLFSFLISEICLLTSFLFAFNSSTLVIIFLLLSSKSPKPLIAERSSPRFSNLDFILEKLFRNHIRSYFVNYSLLNVMININCFYIYINKKLSSLIRIGTRVLLPALPPKLKVYTFQLYKMITKSIRIYFINQFRDGFISNFYRFSLTTDSLLKSHLTTSPINTFLY